jgi:hypothetical protein
MYVLHTAIDTIQKSKRAIFHKIVYDERLLEIGDAYLDAQTKFAKTVVDNSVNMAQYSWDAISRVWRYKDVPSQAPYKTEPKEDQQ